MSVPTRSNKAVTLVKVEIGCDGNGDPWPDDGWRRVRRGPPCEHW